MTSGITAAYGRTVSGVVNVSTKSGGNDFRGDVFYQLRHPRLGLGDPFGARVLERLQQFGGSAGGPVRRIRAFWFAAFERQASSSPRYVEFASLATADRERGPEAFDLFKSMEEPFLSTNDVLAVTPRFDYYFRGGSQLMVQYNASGDVARNSVSIGDPKQARIPNALSHDGTEEDSVHFLTGQFTSVLSPTAVNQFRLTVTSESRPRPANSRQPTVTTSVGNFGTRFFLPTIGTDVTPVIKNSLMLSAGAHDVKVGGDFDRMASDGVFGYNQFGKFVVFSSDPDEVLDILTPGGRIPNRFDAPGLCFRQVADLTGRQRVAHASLFVQDSWRVREGLTVDLGFRWEGQFNQRPHTGNQVLLNRVLAAEFPFGRLNPAATTTDVRQWMPRLGFAWSPSGRWRGLVVRDSYGVFHATTPPVWLGSGASTFRDPPQDLFVALPTTAATVYRQFLAAGIDLNAYPLTDLPVFALEDISRVLSGDPFLGAYLQTVSPDYRNPRAVKSTLGFETGLGGRTVAGLQWMRYRTTRLHGRRDYNLPVPQVRSDDPAEIPHYDAFDRPAPLLGPVVVTETLGRSDYDGVTAHWKYFGDGIQLVTHHTYARAPSSDVNEGYFWEPVYTDHSRPEDEYGPSDLDMRHQLTAHAVLELPGGLSWSAIFRASSAPPLNPVAGTDLNGDRFAFDRALEELSRFLGRNSFRNRAMRNVDMRVLKHFSLAENSRFELSFELSNAFNLDNVKFGAFNAIYGPRVNPETGELVGPIPSFRRLRHQEGAYVRNNTQVIGVGPLQAQVGLPFHF